MNSQREDVLQLTQLSGYRTRQIVERHITAKNHDNETIKMKGKYIFGIEE